MMKILAITKRILKELLRDKRTLALMFLAPILIMWLMNVMFSANSNPHVEITTVNVNQNMRHRLATVDGVSVNLASSIHQAKVTSRKTVQMPLLNINQLTIVSTSPMQIQILERRL